MYKLLIVEDEPLIRTGLRYYFSWEELGFNKILEAENGLEGYHTAVRERPDMIITDIRMPELTGLEMIERLRPELPDTVFILLSGFNEFSYAQKAIRLGNVHAYLLKPLQYEESLAAIKEATLIIESKRLDLRERAELERDVREGVELKGSELVKMLMEDEEPVTLDIIKPLCSELGDTYLFQSFVVSYIPCNPESLQTKRWWRLEAENLVRQAIGWMYGKDTPRRVFTYLYKSRMYVMTIMPGETAEPAGTEPTLPYHETLFLAVGKPVRQLHEFGTSLRQAEKALYQRFSRPGSRLFFGNVQSEPSDSRKQTLPLDEREKNQILACLEHGNAAQTVKLMNEIAIRLSDRLEHTPPEIWLALLQEIISLTLRFANRNGIFIEGMYSDKLLTLSCVDEFQSIEALFAWLAGWMNHISSVYRAASETGSQETQIFEQIETYIREHIDQELTLQMVADRFFYNPSYLSRLFKAKLNKNYMTFITELRIRYAQECLAEPHYLITDVCNMCGYKSYKHFVKTFRSVTNMTPTEYRKQLGL
ncbi:response regulator transcription factor [Paenibacillus silviterrae]|uniref:response regulator transcription factor n=1 Tax=Paenibacillus silviterrae TaxID=3242194 RepID=UPI0025435A84|nr:response regulator [Paenibacillus chinjuensis]